MALKHGGARLGLSEQRSTTLGLNYVLRHGEAELRFDRMQPNGEFFTDPKSQR
jgi:hypothetical protein